MYTHTTDKNGIEHPVMRDNRHVIVVQVKDWVQKNGEWWRVTATFPTYAVEEHGDRSWGGFQMEREFCGPPPGTKYLDWETKEVR